MKGCPIYVDDDVNAHDLIDSLLVCHPKQRITVDEALLHSIPPSAPLNTSTPLQFCTHIYFYCNYFPLIAELSATVVRCQGRRIVHMPLYPYFDPFAGFSMFYPIFF